MLTFNKENTNIYKQLLQLCKLKNDTLTVMLSGGVDSVSALHFLCKQKARFADILQINQLNIQAFHFNHKLRKQNDIMENAVRDLCQLLDVKLHLYQATNTITNEAAAREARFKGAMKCAKDTTLITAHHLDDCIESYLLNVLRGHEGYTPIPFHTQFTECSLVHLFLFHSKSDFIEYSQKHNLTKYIVNDETNFVTKGSRRNLMRQQVIPLLKQNQIVLNKTVYKKMKQKLSNLYA